MRRLIRTLHAAGIAGLALATVAPPLMAQSDREFIVVARTRTIPEHASPAFVVPTMGSAFLRAEPPGGADRPGVTLVSTRRTRQLESDLSFPGDRAFSFRPGQAAVGARWADTLAGEEPDAPPLIRWSVIVGDTVVDDRRLWIVLDSAHVVVDRLRTLTILSLSVPDTGRVEARGTVTGTTLWDSDGDLPYLRWDTLRARGTLTRRGGSSFVVAVDLERTRGIARDVPYPWGVRDDLRTPAQRRVAAWWPGGATWPGADPLLERLRSGAPGLTDSVITAWAASRDVEERRALASVLGTIALEGRDPSLSPRMLALALRAGDTIWAVASVTGRFGRTGRRQGEPVDEGAMDVVLPFLLDPARAQAAGIEPDGLRKSLVDAFTAAPPAATPAPSDWPCTPPACRRLADLRERDDDVALRDVGLVVSEALEPGSAFEELSERAAAGSAFAALMVRLSSGMTEPLRTRGPVALPDSGDSFRAWRRWTDARGSPVAIRMVEARTGRPVQQEIHARAATETTDSARLVFGQLSVRLGGPTPPEEEVARALLSDVAAIRSLGVQQSNALLWSPEAADVPSDTATYFLSTLLETLVEGRPIAWPRETDPSGGSEEPLGRVTAPDTLILVTDGLPEAVVRAWSGRVRTITEAEMAERRPAGTFLEIEPPRVVGALAELVWTVTTQPGGGFVMMPGPGAWASGWRIRLHRTPDGWHRLWGGMIWIT